jgi:dipeptidase E
MRLLLTSAGIKNAGIRDGLVDLLGKPIAESSALCIPTANHGMNAGADPAWNFIAGQEPRTPMVELGWKSMGVLELTALPSIDEDHWVPTVRETDALLVNGGDPLYLCHWMRESGLADLLPSLRDTVYVGLSAGSMVMAPISERTSSRGGPLRSDWCRSRCSRTWTTRSCRRTPWPTRRNGRPACRWRDTRSTTTPRSK